MWGNNKASLKSGIPNMRQVNFNDIQEYCIGPWPVYLSSNFLMLELYKEQIAQKWDVHNGNM